MKRGTWLLSALAVVLGVGQINAAGFVAYSTNPSGNSGDWTSAVTGLGGSINTNVNFDTHPVGPLQNNFYSVSDGVTLSTTGTFAGIQNTAGPGQGNVFLSQPGEGPHAVSNTLITNFGLTTLTISFSQAVVGAGLFTVDYFGNGSILTLDAYDGVNGTGTLLGTATAVAQNFQDNNLYFLGVSDDAVNIQSVVLTHDSFPTGDSIGIDDIRFATTSIAPVDTPEPSSLVLLGMATVSFAGYYRRRCRQQRLPS